MKLSRTLVAMCAYLAPCGVSAAQMPVEPNPALVIFGSDTIRAEVARSPDQRQRGLMFRDAVPEGTGMLFIFDRPDVQGIWMKDTYVPLDVAFLDASFRVVNIESLEPLDLTVKNSARAVLFALEVRQGWFADNEIGPGAQAHIQFR